LFKKHARDGAGNPEAATVAPDELEQGRVGRQVALQRPALEDLAALILVEIIPRMPDIEEAELLQSKRQMGMEIQDYRWHRMVYPVYSVYPVYPVQIPPAPLYERGDFLLFPPFTKGDVMGIFFLFTQTLKHSDTQSLLPALITFL
jgi:hypothetical protein